MRYQLISNPSRRRRRRRHHRTPPRGAGGRFRRKINPSRRRRRRNPSNVTVLRYTPNRARRRRRNPGRRRYYYRRGVVRRSNPSLNPRALLGQVTGAIPDAVVLTGGIFASLATAKTLLKENDEGIKGYLANVAGGLGYAVALGMITKKRDWFRLGVMAAVATPLIRLGIAFFRGKTLPFGITLGFEDYVQVGPPGMSDFLTLDPNARMSDWLTVQPAMLPAGGRLGAIVGQDTIRRYGDE